VIFLSLSRQAQLARLLLKLSVKHLPTLLIQDTYVQGASSVKLQVAMFRLGDPEAGFSFYLSVHPLGRDFTARKSPIRSRGANGPTVVLGNGRPNVCSMECTARQQSHIGQIGSVSH
jgi:hypothetical protein